jgi:hypothetical protein
MIPYILFYKDEEENFATEEEGYAFSSTSICCEGGSLNYLNHNIKIIKLWRHFPFNYYFIFE